MSWKPQPKFEKNKDANKKKKEKKSELLPQTEEKPGEIISPYTRRFLDDWQNCRDRHPGQLEVLRAVFEENAQYVFYRAGRKGAKTTTGIDIAWKLANMAPNRVGYLCYPTIAQGIEVVWEERRLQTCDRKDDSMLEKYVDKVDDNRHTITFQNGSFIKLVGTWTEKRGRGAQPDFMICDEFQDCNADYIEASDANLAAKPHSQCVFLGTPPKKRNHYEEWWERVQNNPKGKTFHYTSYDNVRLPHLKEWLDNKKEELIKANKEDVWLREYMAEFCYSSASRVLPDAILFEEEDISKLITNFAYIDRIPILATSIHSHYFCSVLAILVKNKGVFVIDHECLPHIWETSFEEFYPLLGTKVKNLQDLCGKNIRNLVWDESKSFVDVIEGFTNCRKDLKWQDRGIPLLKEMMIKGRIHFSRNLADFALECQNLMIDESDDEVQKNYPHVCTLAMMVNEYFSRDKISVPLLKPFDQYAAFREMGIPYKPKKKGRLFNFGI